MKMGKSRRRPSALRFVETLVLVLHAGVTAAQQPETTTTDGKGLRIGSSTSSLGLRKADSVPQNDAIEALEQGSVPTESFEVLESDGRQVSLLLEKRLCLFLWMLQSHEALTPTITAGNLWQ
jgi:hypothetical protein